MKTFIFIIIKMAGSYLLAVLLVYFALLDRPRMIGCLTVVPELLCVPVLRSGTEALRAEKPDSASERLEKPVLPAEDSVSLGAVKELVLLLGIANMSSLESFLLSWVLAEDELASEF